MYFTVVSKSAVPATNTHSVTLTQTSDVYSYTWLAECFLSTRIVKCGEKMCIADILSAVMVRPKI